MVANVWKELLQSKYLGCFESVEFAVLDPNQAAIFAQVFETPLQTTSNPKRK